MDINKNVLENFFFLCKYEKCFIVLFSTKLSKFYAGYTTIRRQSPELESYFKMLVNNGIVNRLLCEDLVFIEKYRYNGKFCMEFRTENDIPDDLKRVSLNKNHEAYKMFELGEI